MWRIAVLAALAAAAAAISISGGGSDIAPAVVLSALLHPHGGGDAAVIVWQLRLPRVCIAASVGAMLAVAGALLQGMLRNPLVDPYLTGVSAGAGAAIAVAILSGVAAVAAPGLGFAAGLATAVLVAALARRGSGIDANRLILAGISLSAFFSAVIALAIARSSSVDAATQIVSWLAGSMAGRDWHDIVAAAPYGIAGLLLAAAAAPPLNALRVGDVRAQAAGVNVARAQWIVLTASSLLASAAVSLAGIVGFIGLIVPHIARRTVGADVRLVLPACACIGAAVTMIADLLARTVVAPAELPVGVLLAFAGVPAFLYLYLRGTERRT